MRFTVLKQFTQGLLKTNPEAGKEVENDLTSAKWYLWHGNVKEALDKLIKEYDIRGYDGFGDAAKFPQQMDSVLIRWFGRQLGSVQFHSERHGRTVGLKPGTHF